MDRMTTLNAFGVTRAKDLRANWTALLLPVPVAEMLNMAGWGHLAASAILVLALAVAATLLVPSIAAKVAPFAWFGYGCVGFLVAHTLLRGTYLGWPYEAVIARLASNSVDLVLPEAFVILGVSVWLLVAAGGPFSNVVRQSLHQVLGHGGQHRTVPVLLLLPVIGLWEETYANPLWFGSKGIVGQLAGVAIAAAGVVLVVKRPQIAAVFAVIGLIILGVFFLVYPSSNWYSLISWENHGPNWWLPVGLQSGLNGPVLIGNWGAVTFTRAEGWVLIMLGSLLVPRMLAMVADPELVRRAAALTQRVDRLARTRRDATDTAMAELRRIERDLHDGAQARLVAVGMSLRAAEQLMPSNQEAGLALLAEARETSSRALDDLRGLVRGIYPPVLADRGLGDAVRALALDAPQPVQTDIAVPGEPPVPVAAAVYFGIAEALTNAVRHADAGTVQIELGYAGGLLRATVTDDGVGGADPSRGTGLAGVERRLATFDGVLALTSRVGGPTIVVLEVPCTLAG
jgi:signal transduction histidine kinase